MSHINDKDAYIVSSVRTAVGKAKKGALRNYRPEKLGGLVVREAVARVSGLEDKMVDDVLMGCAMPEGPQGMNMGRIIAQEAGLPDEVPGATVNRFCSSGLQTIAMATQAISAGHADVIVAGGTESMSMVPMSGFYFSPDPAMVEADPDVYISMGNTAENVAEQFDISREDQDAFALESHRRALEAIEKGYFKKEIFPLQVSEVVMGPDGPEKKEFVFDTDEGPRAGSTPEQLAKLRAVFRMGGTVTAANSSQMSDGAAASVLMSGRVVNELGVTPEAKLIGFAVAGVAPEVMGIGPIPAVRKVLEQTGLTLDDIGLIELNEAFASQSLAVIRELGLDREKVNIHGGAIALGHPLGCTGAKLTATLIHALKRRGQKFGICTMCIGGGMGAAGVIENLSA